MIEDSDILLIGMKVMSSFSLLEINEPAQTELCSRF